MAKDWQRKLKYESEKELRKQFTGWSEDHFIAHILSLREHIADLEEQLEGKTDLSAENGQKEALNESMFNQDWSYPTKIHFLLELHQRPLTSVDLHGMLLKMDKHYCDYNSPQKNLSVHLVRAVKSGRIKVIKKPGIKLKLFALPEWVDKENALKTGIKHFR